MCFGVPEKMLTVIRQFQEGMQARVCTNDGKSLGMVRRRTRVAARMRAIAASFQRLLRRCDTRRATALQRGPRDSEGLGSPGFREGGGKH